MRITKTTNFRKTIATTLLLSLLVPAISAAGQFDALYAGASEAEKSAIKTWHQFYPGLEEQIQEAFRRGIDTGNFLFRSNKLPVEITRSLERRCKPEHRSKFHQCRLFPIPEKSQQSSIVIPGSNRRQSKCTNFSRARSYCFSDTCRRTRFWLRLKRGSKTGGSPFC